MDFLDIICLETKSLFFVGSFYDIKCARVTYTISLTMITDFVTMNSREKLKSRVVRNVRLVYVQTKRKVIHRMNYSK